MSEVGIHFVLGQFRKKWLGKVPLERSRSLSREVARTLVKCRIYEKSPTVSRQNCRHKWLSNPDIFIALPRSGKQVNLKYKNCILMICIQCLAFQEKIKILTIFFNGRYASITVWEKVRLQRFGLLSDFCLPNILQVILWFKWEKEAFSAPKSCRAKSR